MIRKILPVALAGLMAASSVQAAEAMKASLAQASGEVVLLSAKGAASAHAGAGLAAGDRLVVKTGQASLQYADGCAVTLKAGSMATIGAKSPCAGGAGLVAVNPAEPAQLGQRLRHITLADVLAGVGSVAIAGAVIDGVINADNRCNTYVNQTCGQPISD